MAFDEGLAERIRELLRDEPAIEEKRMFGGLVFMVRGHMCCGIVKSELMVRVGTDAYDTLLALPHAREMDFTGRALKGMLYIAEEGIEDDHALQEWLDRAITFVHTKPPKL